MFESSHRLRGFIVAVVVLALSAGAVFAGEALEATDNAGTERASEEAGFLVPVGQSDVKTETDEEETSGSHADEADEGGAEEHEPEAVLTLHDGGDNHGRLVSTAATMATPEGFRNHGHFVSCAARMKDLAISALDPSALTAESCDDDAEVTEADADEESSDLAARVARGHPKAADKAGKRLERAESKGEAGRGRGQGR